MNFTLPVPPNLANARTHWRVKNKERKRYLESCDTLLSAGLLPDAPSKPLTPVIIQSSFFLAGTRLCDDDNAMSRVKWPIDWLRTRGYIEDDGRNHCRILVPEQAFDRKNPRLVITIRHNA